MPDPARRGFAGWRIVALSALAFGMTGPGQTAGVSVFVDPMIAALGLTRSEIASAYLVGTLAGAVAMPWIGRLTDERGVRFAMSAVAAAFGAVLVGMGAVQGPITLVLGFVGIRMLGQGGLSLIATIAPAAWFERRRGLAIGITTACGSALLSLVPLVSAAVIGEVGWRWAWVVTGLAVWAIVLPIARFGMIDRPEHVGHHVDGVAPIAGAAAEARPAEVAYTRAQALREPIFWAVAGGVAATGMIGTGLAFHQLDLLGEQGLSRVEAAANFLPQTAAMLAVTLLVGTLVDRVAPRWLLIGAMTLLAGAMLGVPYVRTGVPALIWGVAIGSAGAAARALEAASFPRIFGVRHLGSIRGVVTGISVASTAFGPVALSIGHDLAGSYVQVLVALLVIPALVALLALVARAPTRDARP